MDKKIRILIIFCLPEMIKMPGYDRTGPQGLGRMTGRKFGPCANENLNKTDTATGTEEGAVAPGIENNPSGEVIYGLGRGGVPRGCGRGFGGGRRGRGNPRRW